MQVPIFCSAPNAGSYILFSSLMQLSSPMQAPIFCSAHQCKFLSSAQLTNASSSLLLSSPLQVHIFCSAHQSKFLIPRFCSAHQYKFLSFVQLTNAGACTMLYVQLTRQVPVIFSAYQGQACPLSANSWHLLLCEGSVQCTLRIASQSKKKQSYFLNDFQCGQE
jgi:hypothetical protein